MLCLSRMFCFVYHAIDVEVLTPSAGVAMGWRHAILDATALHASYTALHASYTALTHIFRFVTHAPLVVQGPLLLVPFVHSSVVAHFYCMRANFAIGCCSSMCCSAHCLPAASHLLLLVVCVVIFTIL